MANCSISEQSGIPCLSIKGRIDGMSSPEVQGQLDMLILSGKRNILIDMEQVSYVSSAGLRVFFLAQRQLVNVGGEIILWKISDTVLPVFTMSGLSRLLKIVSTDQELLAVAAVTADAMEITALKMDGISFKIKKNAGAESGKLEIIGSEAKLVHSDYEQEDVVTVPLSELNFGTGLATAGERFEEYKSFFGEALMVNHNFYFYPAIKRPAVDFIYYSGKDTGTACRFLHGFAFNGQYRYFASFDTNKEFITLERLVQWILTLELSADLIGIVLLAESKGVFGMNLKQIPFKENRPAQEDDIMATKNFASWINFPIDPADENNIIVGAGLVCRNKEACPENVRQLFASTSNLHMHAGIFAKGPLSKNIEQFSSELDRVMTELEVSKIQHLLGQSRFSNGMIGIIELKG